MNSRAIDLLEIKEEHSVQDDQNSESECISPLDGTSNANLYATYMRNADFRRKIKNGQIELKYKDNDDGRSDVWNIFSLMLDENGDEIKHLVVCRECFQVYKYMSSTSNLVKHKCYIQVKLVDEASLWLIRSCRPLTILDDPGLKKMARMFLTIGATLGEDVNIDDFLPKQEDVKEGFVECYLQERAKLCDELMEIGWSGYSITCCVCIDSFIKRSFLSVTIHYVKQSSMISHLLSVSPVNSDFNSDNKIEKYVMECLQDFECDLDRDDPIIVTDRIFPTAFLNHHQIYCIVNFLNNIIEVTFRTVPQFQQLLDKCIKFVKDKMDNSGSSSRNPIFYYLNSVNNDPNDSKDITINKIEIKAVVSILQSFEETLLALEKENTPTMHMIIPHLYKLNKVCDNNDEDIPIATSLKNQLKAELKIFESQHITKYHRIALFLFPPTKKLLLFNELERKTTIKECKAMMQQFNDDTESCRKRIKIDVEYCKDGVFSDFIEQWSSGDNKIDTIDKEINEYQAKNITLSEEFHVLEWWKVNQVTFPLLHKVSSKVLGTPASSTPSQRGILQARNLLGANPTAMPCDDDTINEIIFVNNNYKY